MPEKYLDNALSYTTMGNSQVYAAAFLHKLVFGRCEEDKQSQLYFTDKSIIIEPKDFFDITLALCAGKDKLLELENGGHDVSFEKGRLKTL